MKLETLLPEIAILLALVGLWWKVTADRATKKDMDEIKSELSRLKARVEDVYERLHKRDSK